MLPSETITFSRPLLAHQKQTLDRFAYEAEAGLFHEMGTGKTTSAIAILRAKYRAAGEVLPTLIICPVAVLENWVAEFKINSPEKVWRECQILYKSGAKRLEDFLASDKKIIITNTEALDMAPLIDAFFKRRFTCVVVDELHNFKNHKSKRLKALLRVSDLAKYRIGLTGTPISNSYLDLWAIFRVLDRGQTFGLSYYVFRNQFFEDANMSWAGKKGHFHKFVPKPGIAHVLSKMMEKKASVIKKLDCLDLPEQVFLIEHVQMSSEQEAAYYDMETELLAEVASGECAATNALARCTRLLQILSGYLPVEHESGVQTTHRFKSVPRLNRLKELLTELVDEHKVIVWCQYKENYKDIKAVCEELGAESAELTGETTDRQDEIDRFNLDPKCRVMVANPKAGGVGVNLIASDCAIYFNRSYSLLDREQSLARNFRKGSEIHDKVTIVDLVCKGTIDEDVLFALSEKKSFSDVVLEKLRLRYQNASASK